MTKVKVWSNIFFLLPLGLALVNRLYLYSLIIFIAMAISFLFHYGNEKKLTLIDEIAAYILMICNFVYCWLGGFSNPYFLFVVVLSVFAIFFYYKRSDNTVKSNYNHSVWHILSAFITFFSILTFIK